MAIGSIVGGAIGATIGGVGSLVGGNEAKKAAQKQVDILGQMKDLQNELTESKLEKAERMYKDVYGENLVSQAGSGFRVDSATFQGVRSRVTSEYLKDVERIKAEGQLYNLGIDAQIQGLKASTPNTLESTLSFLTGTTSGFVSGYSLISGFK
jgi:hypothetical protein